MGLSGQVGNHKKHVLNKWYQYEEYKAVLQKRGD